jgi:hypothetical protein
MQCLFSPVNLASAAALNQPRDIWSKLSLPSLGTSHAVTLKDHYEKHHLWSLHMSVDSKFSVIHVLYHVQCNGTAYVSASGGQVGSTCALRGHPCYQPSYSRTLTFWSGQPHEATTIQSTRQMRSCIVELHPALQRRSSSASCLLLFFFSFISSSCMS